jgi:3-methyl-2-oxobutanoate hydroxymethyltransferase
VTGPGSAGNGGQTGTGPRQVTVRDFLVKKQRAEPIVVISAYDALFGRLAEEGGADAILVGDSLGNVVAGYDSTLPVTLDQMIYHAASVRRGVAHTMVIIDMPFLTYQVSEERAMLNTGRAIQETGAHAVKFEGAADEILRSVRAVIRLGIPVMGHLGFTPQSVNALGGFRVQGRDAKDATQLVDDARRLEDAGVFSIVLELMPAEVGARITGAVAVPTIGIGAGGQCDGQVLVLHDLLGLNDRFSPRYLKRYANLAHDVRDAVARFRDDVVAHRYPDAEHSF